MNPSTERETSWSAAGSHPGLLEQRLERHADPASVADVRTADLVRDARQRDVAFDQFAGDELLEVQGDLPIDHAVDPQRPVLGADRGHEQGGVDPVELVVRRDERAEAGDTQLSARRRRRRDVHRLRDLERRARLIGGEPPREELPRGARREGGAHRSETTQQEPASFDPDRGRRLGIVRMLLRQAGVQEDQRARSGDGAHERRQRVDRRPGGPRHGRDHPRAARTRRGRSSRRSGCGPTPSPATAATIASTTADADQQHRLIAGAEGADREALQPFGGEIDRGGPHRDHRRGLPAHEAGHQVGDGDAPPRPRADP